MPAFHQEMQTSFIRFYQVLCSAVLFIDPEVPLWSSRHRLTLDACSDHYFCSLPILSPILNASTLGSISFGFAANLCSMPFTITSSGTASVAPT